MDFLLAYILPLFIIYLGISLYVFLFRKKYTGHILLFLFFVTVYSLTNYRNITGQSIYRHFVDFADALLNGRWYLDSQPGYHDISFYDDKYFVGFGPLPALLMMPFVLIYGTSFNDIFFTVILGAVNCVLVYNMMLRLFAFQPERKGDKRVPLVMTFFFGLGTVHWYLSSAGAVWNTAQIVTTFFLLLAVHEALGPRRYWLVGIWAALPILSRPSVFSAFPFFILLWLSDLSKEREPKKHFINLGWYLLPYVCVGVLYGLFNLLRFGNPLDFGFTYMQHSEHLMRNLEKYGTLHPHFFPINARIFFLGFFSLLQKFPFIGIPSMGLSIFLTCPLIIYGFRCTPFSAWKELRRGRYEAFLRREAPGLGAWLAVLCILLPLLFFFNTGWMQFGYRYSLDFIPLLLIPVALGLGKRIRLPAWILLGAGILITAYGSIVFHNFPDLVVPY